MPPYCLFYTINLNYIYAYSGHLYFPLRPVIPAIDFHYTSIPLVPIRSPLFFSAKKVEYLLLTTGQEKMPLEPLIPTFNGQKLFFLAATCYYNYQIKLMD